MELIQWDAIQRADLAVRASNNALRYVELFCTVIDDILESIPLTNNTNSTNRISNSNTLNREDLLHEQRLAQQRASREANRIANGGGGDLGMSNVDLGEVDGNLQNDLAVTFPRHS